MNSIVNVTMKEGLKNALIILGIFIAFLTLDLFFLWAGLIAGCIWGDGTGLVVGFVTLMVQNILAEAFGLSGISSAW